VGELKCDQELGACQVVGQNERINQVTEVGLISKAVNKAERAEGREEAGMEPEVPPRLVVKKKRGKRKRMIALAALLLVGLSCAAGYFLWLGPETESPPQVVRRSVRAKRKPPPAISKQPQRQVGAEEDESEKKKMISSPNESRRIPPAGEGGQSGTGESKRNPMTARKAAGQRQEEGLNVRSPEDEALQAKEVISPQPGKGSISQEGEISEILKPHTEVLQTPEESSPSEEETLLKTTPDESEIKELEEPIQDQTVADDPGGMVSEELIKPASSQQREEWVQRALEVTERSNSRAESYYQKGVVYHQGGELDKAIDFYRKALTFNPDHLPADMNLATAYLQVGRFKEAEQILVHLYALKPKDGKVLFNFALLLYRTGEYPSAKNKLDKLLESDPLHLEGNLLLASIYEEEGEFRRALEPCIKAYQINSADSRVLYRLGRIWDMLGESEKAAKYYQLLLNSRSKIEHRLESAVRDRLNYLSSQKEGR
jgi:Flp pilus assembly protein TadD